jgi:hypothetical protein
MFEIDIAAIVQKYESKRNGKSEKFNILVNAEGVYMQGVDSYQLLGALVSTRNGFQLLKNVLTYERTMKYAFTALRGEVPNKYIVTTETDDPFDPRMSQVFVDEANYIYMGQPVFLPDLVIILLYTSRLWDDVRNLFRNTNMDDISLRSKISDILKVDFGYMISPIGDPVKIDNPAPNGEYYLDY